MAATVTILGSFEKGMPWNHALSALESGFLGILYIIQISMYINNILYIIYYYIIYIYESTTLAGSGPQTIRYTYVAAFIFTYV